MKYIPNVWLGIRRLRGIYQEIVAGEDIGSAGVDGEIRRSDVPEHRGVIAGRESL